MRRASNIEVQKHAELGFRSSRNRIEEEYKKELAGALSELDSKGIKPNIAAREGIELRLKAEKLEKLVAARTESFIESFESHGAPIDEAEILREVTSLSAQTSAAMVSSYTSEVTMRGVRTGRRDPTLTAKARSFQMDLMRKNHVAMTDAKLLIQKRKLAETKRPLAQPHIHQVIHQHGPNARVNNPQSIDQSTNTVIVRHDDVFVNLHAQLAANVSDAAERTEILRRLSALEEANGTPAWTERFGAFIASAADWTTLITPFLPALIEIGRKTLS